MRTCDCGGFLYKAGIAKAKSLPAGNRYRCKQCGKVITVRGGEVCQHKGRPPKHDEWRG